MTRFLSRALAGLEGGSVNKETNRLFAYHHATKHTYHSVRTNAHFLDWHNQPDPFRTYDGATLVTLPIDPGFPKVGTFATMAALAEGSRTSQGSKSGCRGEVQLDLTWLSRLLWHSMAISAWKRVSRTGYRYSLRVNPSSGNLHPTETHLALLGFRGVEDGVYHYRADRHALEVRSPGDWTERIARDLALPWAAESPLIVGLTSVFWREAWKYRDRAYRYCCHDLGHAMMSLLLAAQALGLPGGVVAHFSDVRLTHTLGLTGSDEAPMAFLVFPSQDAPPSGRLATQLQQVPMGVPNELSLEEVPYDLLLGMHRATILSDHAGPVPRVSLAKAGSAHDPLSLPGPARDAPLETTVRRRRSALDFDPRTPPMERDDVEQLLDFATRNWPADWRGNFSGERTPAERGADFVTLYLYFHRVRGCEPGVYRWDKSGRRLEQLHRANVERVAAYLSLEQALAGNACFAVSMVADLAQVARGFGNRGYRYVHFEAGAIGQRLYIGAEALGWNATGIGAFYDDDVHRYLGFLEEGEEPMGVSLHAAEQAALVMLGSPSSRAAAREQNSCDSAPVISESGEEHLSGLQQFPENEEEAVPRKDPRTLPRQVIYHFAVGRAIPDLRLEA
jgi:SagB-type dehydrogenase family enzyme